MKENWKLCERSTVLQQDTVGLAAGRSPRRAAGGRECTRLLSSICIHEAKIQKY